MFKDPKNTAQLETTKTPGAGEGTLHPESLKPWEDRSLSLRERFEAYRTLVHEKLAEIAAAFDRAGSANDTATQKEIMNSSETKKWMEEGTFLKTSSAEKLCQRIDRPIAIRELLGKNFLGAEAWASQEIDVGAVPPIPESLTAELLECECPLHPGEKIKDTHVLVLVPKSVDGAPFSPRKLNELCMTRKGSGSGLIYHEADWATRWQGNSWASTPQSASEWVLIPKNDPDPETVPAERHFRGKRIAAQQKVHEAHYSEYREVKAVELMTAVLLYDLVNQKRLLPDYLRCGELSAYGGRVCVGQFLPNGLKIPDDDDLLDEYDDIGRALARNM